MDTTLEGGSSIMEQQKVFILVEGVNDLKVLKDFLGVHYMLREESIEPMNANYVIIENSEFLLHIEELKGWTFIKDVEKQKDIREKKELGYLCLVVIDADDKTKDEGGFEIRKKVLENIKTEQGLDFDFFLLPNHKDDGDLEVLLLEEYVKKSGYQFVLDCIEEYKNCLSSNNTSELEFKVPNKKELLYKEIPSVMKNRAYNYESEVFASLKTFFQKHLKDGSP